MSEEKFEAWLKEHADEYHRPPANIPREEMWDAITRARQARPAADGRGALIAAEPTPDDGRDASRGQAAPPHAARRDSPDRCRG